jgi:phenylacetate-CoA ligase
MNRLIHRHILLPAFETLFKRRKTFRYWSELERTQWLPRAQIEALQFQALTRLIKHASDRCPYYSESWERLGLHPGMLSSLQDFERWPILTREDIREHRLSMRAIGSTRPLISKATGGSSGVPLQFDLDQDSNDRRNAAWHRGYGWAGAEPGTRQLSLWGGPLGPRSWRVQIKDALYHRLYRRRVVSCFDPRDNLADRFAAEVNRRRPDVIVAYTNPLYEVAKRLNQCGRASHFRPKAIIVGAEKLHPFQRHEIESFFGAPVFETYGSREFMLIGAECEQHRGLHLTSEHLLVEVLDDAGRPTPAGEEGNVVITDLYNYGMPFVRYATGERARAGFTLCECGRGLPLLQKVVGRRLDMLQAPDGRSIPGEFFPHLVKDFPAVRRFQVIQEEHDRIRFTLTADGMTPKDRSTLELLVRDAVGPSMRVDFEPVPNIQLTSAGKLQVVINNVARKRAG